MSLSPLLESFKQNSKTCERDNFADALSKRFSFSHLETIWSVCAAMQTDIKLIQKVIGLSESVLSTPIAFGSTEASETSPERKTGIRIFVVEDGTCGLVPDCAQIGDMLCTDIEWSDMNCTAIIRRSGGDQQPVLVGRCFQTEYRSVTVPVS